MTFDKPKSAFPASSSVLPNSDGVCRHRPEYRVIVPSIREILLELELENSYLRNCKVAPANVRTRNRKSGMRASRNAIWHAHKRIRELEAALREIGQ